MSNNNVDDGSSNGPASAVLPGRSSNNPSSSTSTSASLAGGGGDNNDGDDLQSAHRRRLATILRYLAAMHRSAGGGGGGRHTDNDCFVRALDRGDGASSARDALTSEFFVPSSSDSGGAAAAAGADDGTVIGNDSVVFALSDFRAVPHAAESGLFASPPFSFYAAASGSDGGGAGSGQSGGGSSRGASRAATSTSGVSLSWEPRTTSSSAGDGNARGRNKGADSTAGADGGRWTVSAWSKQQPSSSTTGGAAPSRRRRGGGDDDGSAAGTPCWLRLTRIKAEEPPAVVPGSTVGNYLEAWAQRRGSGGGGARSVRRLLRDLDSHSLEHGGPPALDPSTPERKRHEIKSFLKRYRRYLRRDAVRRALEPIYDRLFELAQRAGSVADCSDSEELVMGFGNARMVLSGDSYDEDGGGGRVGGGGTTTVVNGPLIEVRVEVELAPDGALLVRPCEHTGVELNREVLAALATDGGGGGPEVLAALHRAVSEMETRFISPAQPGTYSAMLKRMAVELCSGGRFVSSSSSSSSATARGALHKALRGGSNKLLVTDSWCCYHRPKPSSVWARDAQILAELISKSSGSSAQPPRAALSLTHGPGALASSEALDRSSMAGRVAGSLKSLLSWTNTSSHGKKNTKTQQRPLFPLPTSSSQDRIHRLLSSGAPAVVVEGPPGCGKTHSIANIVCSYLATGKRVLVTSKGAPALSVLRQRLPECMQELCVDATVSEAAGMQQLQQTVERLAYKVSCGVDKTVLCESLQAAIDQLEADIADIDEKLEQYHDRKSALLRKAEGQELTDAAFSVVAEAPWMAATMAEWATFDMKRFVDKVEALVDERDRIFDEVSGYTSPPSDRLIAGVAAKAGMALPSLTGNAVRTMAAIPVLGSLSGARSYQDDVESDLEAIKVFGEAPTTESDWNIALRAIKHDKEHWRLYDDAMSDLVDRQGWPKDCLYDNTKEKLSFNEKFVDALRKASRAKEIQHKLVVPSDMAQAQESQKLEVQRSKMVARLQDMDGKLVEGKVITKLSQMFSPEAQSALIKFAQLAGKAKFKSNAQASRLSQRQQRHRQEYLKAFEQCVRYIPCWILTTNQVNDYLPAEFGLFDVCVIDEASQSDITALPSMLRGKQWLVVGDGKQVSPTEGFISEDQIDSLRVSLPDSPFRGCFLPGHSFFDLCAQAFPIGRVVLTEHFRCAPEIVAFSNGQYYQDRLHPLRLPTSHERMSPSLVDIKIDGRKVGKVNEGEANEIVKMIEAMVKENDENSKRRKSIGVICLVGDEQSRLIRGRLLDAIGPEKYNRHNILVGEPPTFQGSERDVIFLSLVSSPGSVPTQSQLLHHQRINVALSRARDRMVLVRSIGRSQVPSVDDVKVPVIEFFSEYGSNDLAERDMRDMTVARNSNERDYTSEDDMAPLRDRIVGNLSTFLRGRGYTTTPMGVVWRNAVCVENGDTGARAAVAFEGCGELKEEWTTTISQQRSIERVGWQCLRIDALSWMLDHKRTVNALEMFLKSVGVEKRVEDGIRSISSHGGEEASNYGADANAAVNAAGHADEQMQDGALPQEVAPVQEVVPAQAPVHEVAPVQEAASGVEMEVEAPLDLNRAPAHRANASSNDVVVISSNDDDDDYIEVSSTTSSFAAMKDEEDDCFQPNQYGDVVNLEIVGNAAATSSIGGGSRLGRDLGADSSDSESESLRPRRKQSRKTKKKSDSRSGGDDCKGDESVDNEPRRKQGRKAKKKSNSRSEGDYYSVDESADNEPRRRQGRKRKKSSGRASEDEDYQGDESDSVEDSGEVMSRNTTLSGRKRSKRRKLDSYSRDGRWYPGYAKDDKDDDGEIDADEEDWEDLKDVISDASVGSENSGSPSENLRSRSSASRSGPPSHIVSSNPHQSSSSDDFFDCVEDEEKQDQGNGDVKEENPKEDTCAANPETMEEGKESEREGKSDPDVITLL